MIPPLADVRKLNLDQLADMAFEASQEAERIYRQGEWEAEFPKWQEKVTISAMAEQVMGEK